MNAGVLLVLAGCLHLLGTWGRRNASQLMSVGLPAHQRDSKERTLRRGAWACHGASVLLLVAAGLSLV